MKRLNTVQLENDSLLSGGDLNDTVNVTDTLPMPGPELVDQFRFLNRDVISSYSIKGRVLQALFRGGRLYKCVEYYYPDPATGELSKEYKWADFSYEESGALERCVVGMITQGKTMNGTTSIIITWTDPVDIVSSTDPTIRATWKYTAIVRKNNVQPTSINDGEIVGFSSVRNQYNRTGFMDIVPESLKDTMKYNLFAVTVSGVATGLNDEQRTDLDWHEIQELLKNRAIGTLLPIGSTLSVNHKELGSIVMRVVAIDNADIDPSLGIHQSATLMVETPLFRAAYDVKEKPIDARGVPNPGDLDRIAREQWCSARGRAKWQQSNLRRWLNGEVYEYRLSEDSKYDTSKYYFVKNGDQYVIVPDPVDPSRVNPSTKGYLELISTDNPSIDDPDVEKHHEHDEIPAPFDPIRLDAGYTFKGKQLPGFLTGFEKDPSGGVAFIDLVVPTRVTTINDDYLQNQSTHPVAVTNDKVFVPSFRELFGREPSGLEFVKLETGLPAQEGKQFKYCDPAMPNLDPERSLVKLDEDGNVCGYWLRTLETVPVDITGSVWYNPSASGVWCVRSRDFRRLPAIGTGVTESTGCHLSVEMAQERDPLTNNKIAPGVVFCIVIAA